MVNQRMSEIFLCQDKLSLVQVALYMLKYPFHVVTIGTSG